MSILKPFLRILAIPIMGLLTLMICVGFLFVSGLVMGGASIIIGLLGVVVMMAYSPQNGLILMLIAFLLSPFGMPKFAICLLGKILASKNVAQDLFNN